MLAAAIEAEVSSFIERYGNLKTDEGKSVSRQLGGVNNFV